MKPKILILTGVGINSERELFEAFDLAGAEPVYVHVSELGENPKRALDFQVVALPGGFSYGDHLASGKILANFLRMKLGPLLETIVERKTPVIGICNGFQILVKLGLLPRLRGRIEQEISLVHNDSAKYEDRWVRLGVTREAASRSPWFKGLSELRCPVRHGEGKLVCGSAAGLAKLEKSGCVALRYLDGDGKPARSYPGNPNGSWNAVAGITDKSGLVFGLMPHPEVAIHGVQSPDPAGADERGGFTPCLQLFRNIVDYLG